MGRLQMQPQAEKPKLTDGQVTAVFQVLLGIPPRQADLALGKAFGFDGWDVESLAEYLWDHWMGEPRSPSLRKVEREVRRVLKEKEE